MHQVSHQALAIRCTSDDPVSIPLLSLCSTTRIPVYPRLRIRPDPIHEAILFPPPRNRDDDDAHVAAELLKASAGYLIAEHERGVCEQNSIICTVP
jgi:hypothetical protein